MLGASQYNRCLYRNVRNNGYIQNEIISAAPTTILLWKHAIITVISKTVRFHVMDFGIVGLHCVYFTSNCENVMLHMVKEGDVMPMIRDW